MGDSSVNLARNRGSAKTRGMPRCHDGPVRDRTDQDFCGRKESSTQHPQNSLGQGIGALRFTEPFAHLCVFAFSRKVHGASCVG